MIRPLVIALLLVSIAHADPQPSPAPVVAAQQQLATCQAEVRIYRAIFRKRKAVRR